MVRKGIWKPHSVSSFNLSSIIPLSFLYMRKLCPNLDNEDGLDTVLEVPIPEEMFSLMGSTAALRWHNLRAFMKNQSLNKPSTSHFPAGVNSEFMALLKLVGSPLIPLQVHCDNGLTRPIRDCSIVRSFCFSNNILTIQSFLFYQNYTVFLKTF